MKKETIEVPDGMKLNYSLVPDNDYGLPLDRVLSFYAPGRKLKAFKVPQEDDEWIAIDGHIAIGWVSSTFADKRIILEPKTKKKYLIVEYEIVPNGIMGDYRSQVSERSAAYYLDSINGLPAHIEEREE